MPCLGDKHDHVTIYLPFRSFPNLFKNVQPPLKCWIIFKYIVLLRLPANEYSGTTLSILSTLLVTFPIDFNSYILHSYRLNGTREHVKLACRTLQHLLYGFVSLYYIYCYHVIMSLRRRLSTFVPVQKFS